VPLGKAFAAILVMAAVTLFTRSFPFLFFRKRKPPEALNFVRDYIPPAVMALLVLSCFKDVRWTDSPFGLPALASAALVAVLHLWKRNALISIGVGTAFYMLLTRSGIL
jgi:branched-subunit amino acid transport protein AzlD